MDYVNIFYYLYIDWRAFSDKWGLIIMPLKIKHKFEKEYGNVKGDKIFYAWENKWRSK